MNDFEHGIFNQKWKKNGPQKQILSIFQTQCFATVLCHFQPEVIHSSNKKSL